MISVSCSCGKTLRAKDEYAGRKARCPGCGETVSFPAAVSEEEFFDDDELSNEAEDDWDEEPEVPVKKKNKSSGGKKSKARKKGSGSGWGPLKLAGGVLAILLGLVITVGVVMAVADGQPRALRAGFFAFVCFATGGRWLMTMNGDDA
jgi:hypothetical protein